MIQAIIFDCFGVLASDGWTPFKDQYIVHDPELAAAVGRLGKQVDAGKRSYEDMILETAHLTGVGESVVRTAIERKVPNEELFKYIAATLQSKYKIGILSNASYDVMGSLFTVEQAALVDEAVLSYDVGLVKPDPKMYQTIIERLKIVPEACVMVDDQARHCAGAMAVGMQAILYENNDQLKTELEALLEETNG